MFVKEGEELNVMGCGNRLLATVYFLSFMVIVSFIFLNLFIAIILESFDTSKDEEGLKVGASTINKFKEFWGESKFDPKGLKFIKINLFPYFLMKIIDEEIRQRIIYKEKIRKDEIELKIEWILKHSCLIFILMRSFYPFIMRDILFYIRI